MEFESNLEERLGELHKLRRVNIDAQCQRARSGRERHSAGWCGVVRTGLVRGSRVLLSPGCSWYA
jgi:hypothetical protein